MLLPGRAERVRLSCSPPEVAQSSLEWALLAERCRLPRLQAKCEAWLAGNFNALKSHPQARTCHLGSQLGSGA
jgi:hypothetical protein